MADANSLLDVDEVSGHALQSQEASNYMQSTPGPGERATEHLQQEFDFNHSRFSASSNSRLQAFDDQSVNETEGTLQGPELFQLPTNIQVNTEFDGNDANYSDRETVGDDRDSKTGDDVDDGDPAADDPSSHSEAIDSSQRGLHVSSSADSLDLLAATNRQLLCDCSAADSCAETSSVDFSDLMPSSVDPLADNESLSSSLLGPVSSLEPDGTIRWTNLLGDNAPIVFGSSTGVCGVCSKKVYPMEMITADSVAYHKNCYKCVKCKRLLSVGNFGVLSGALYCQVHYTEAIRLQDCPTDQKTTEKAEPPETSDPIRGRMKRRTSQADELPPSGMSKNILNFFHNLELQSKQNQQQQQQAKPHQLEKPELCRLSLSSEETVSPKIISPISPGNSRYPTTVIVIADDSKSRASQMSPSTGQLATLPTCTSADTASHAESTADTAAAAAAAAAAKDDYLPAPGKAKALLDLWRKKEAGLDDSAAAAAAAAAACGTASSNIGASERRGSLVKSQGTGPAATEKILQTSGLTRSASSCAVRPKTVELISAKPPSSEEEQQQQQQQESELPPVNNTKSMLQLWRQFDQLGGPAPNPETAQLRLRQNQRSYRVKRSDNSSNRYFSATAAAAAAAARASADNDEDYKNHIGNKRASLEAKEELPPEGTTKNLLALFSN